MFPDVTCNLCYGARVDKDGNRCIDCQGLGRFPHWKRDRIEEAIRSEMSGTMFALEIAKADLELAEAETPKNANGRPKYDLWVETNKWNCAYWKFRLETLKAELKTIGKHDERVGDGYLFD